MVRAQRAIVAALSDIATILQLPERYAEPLPGEERAAPKTERAAKRTPARGQAAEAGTRDASARGTRWWLPALALAMVIGVVAWKFVTAPTTELPAELMGEWVTTNPKYAGRKVTFREGKLVLELDPRAGAAEYAIKAVEVKPVNGRRNVAVTYVDNGGDQVLQINLWTGDPPQFELAQPPGVIWQHPGK